MSKHKDQNQEEIISLLQGQWSDDDKQVSFIVTGTDITSIKGFSDTETGNLEVKRAMAGDWSITVRALGWLNETLFIIDKKTFSIYAFGNVHGRENNDPAKSFSFQRIS